jgi:hypothetical protein
LCALPRRQAEGRLKMRQQGGEEDERRVDGDRAWRRPETVWSWWGDGGVEMMVRGIGRVWEPSRFGNGDRADFR